MYPAASAIGNSGTASGNYGTGRPGGCFLHNPNKHLHFNTNSVGGSSHGNDYKICSCGGGSSYVDVGSGHCVDSSNRRPPHCYTQSISDENTCKSACTAVSGCSAYEWGQTGGYCQLIWETGISSLNNAQHSATTGSCSSSVLNNWKYNLNGDSNYAGGSITSTYHNTGGKCYARGLRGEGVQWQNKCPAPESYPVKWDHVNGAAIPTSALTAGGARRGTFTIKSISNNKVTLSDDTVFTMPEKVDSQHPDAFGTGGASQYKCWKRS